MKKILLFTLLLVVILVGAACQPTQTAVPAATEAAPAASAISPTVQAPVGDVALTIVGKTETKELTLEDVKKLPATEGQQHW